MLSTVIFKIHFNCFDETYTHHFLQYLLELNYVHSSAHIIKLSNHNRSDNGATFDELCCVNCQRQCYYLKMLLVLLNVLINVHSMG